ncbi:hypothetical protein RB653_006476 [Dictyostelium firmibasis]|uniref:Uncharacterized protein n=1 Tax=Dictyostelium firmibasis TaxID=79012 RepID=A0AAN7U8Z3_9MYCE
MEFYTHFNIERNDIEMVTYILKVLLACKMFNCVVPINTLFYRVLCCTALTLASPTISSVLLNQLPKYLHPSHEYVLPFVISLSLLFNLLISIYKRINKIPDHQLLNENNLIIKIFCSLFCVVIGMDDIFSVHCKAKHIVQKTVVGSLFMGFMSVGLGTFIGSVVRKVNRGEPNILENPTLDFIAINIMVTIYYFYKDIGSKIISLPFYNLNLYVDEIFLFSFALIYSSIYALDIYLLLNHKKRQLKYNYNKKFN